MFRLLARHLIAHFTASGTLGGVWITLGVAVDWWQYSRAKEWVVSYAYYALIGCGARAQIGHHIPECEPGSRVAWVVDTEEAGRRRAVSLFPEATVLSSVDELLSVSGGPGSGQVRGAVVCTPDDTHYEVARVLLEAGIPVYLEKPMSVALQDSDALLEVAQRVGTLLYVGHNMRHMSVVRLMKELIDSGAIGQVQAVWCRHFVGHGGDYYFKDWHADRSRSGTLLLQKGCHDIDVIHYLAGASTQVVQGMGDLKIYGDVTSRRDNSDMTMREWFSMEHWPPRASTNMHPVIDVEDISMLQMRLSNGVLASYQQCHFTPDYWRNYTVIGDEGRLENFGDSEGGVVRVWNRRHNWSEKGDAEYPIIGDQGGHGDADVLTMREWIDMIRSGQASLDNPRAARDAVATAVMGAQSLRNGSIPTPIPHPGA